MTTKVVCQDNKHVVKMTKTLAERCYDIKKWIDNKTSKTLAERNYGVIDSPTGR